MLVTDLAHPSNQVDPYPLYRHFREHDPIHWSATLRMWVVTRHDDVLHVLQRPEYSVDRFRRIDSAFLRRRPDMENVARIMRDWAVYRDPPDHHRLRALLNKTFTPAQVEGMRPRILAIIDELLGRLPEDEPVEFLSGFAFPLPAIVIGTMLGAPADDMPQIKTWSDQIAAYIGGAQAGKDNIVEAQRGLQNMCDYFRALARARSAAPRDDLVSVMLAAEDSGAMLSEDEVVSNCVLLLFAGHETTTNLLGNGLNHLLRRPEQWHRLRDDRELLPRAVDELLRFDTPVAGTIRVVSETTRLGGHDLANGDLVAAFMASANRDGTRIDRADELDVTRDGPRHLSFGHGIHFCLGASLARLEVQLALRTLLERYDVELLEEAPDWKPQIFFRGLKRLRLRLRPSH